jgi:hypothetical protein
MPTTQTLSYQLLQHPAADSKSIKAAYYSMMRLYHPDQQGPGSGSPTSSGSSTDGEATDSIDTNEFCALLNEIYTVSVCACATSPLYIGATSHYTAALRCWQLHL